jgi:hypothetical protein
MTPSSLRSPEKCEIHDSMVDDISGSFECLDRHVDDLARVVLDGRDVLDQHERGTEDPRRPCHPRVEGVPRILPPRVIVQVGMPLARRSSDKDIDGADEPRQPSLRVRQRAPVVSVDQLPHEPQSDIADITVAAIVAVHSASVPWGELQADGVSIVPARRVPDLLQALPPMLGPERVAWLADRARLRFRAAA